MIRHQIHLEVVLQTIFFVANFKWFSETRGYVSVLVPEQSTTRGYPSGSLKPGEKRELFVEAA